VCGVEIWTLGEVDQKRLGDFKMWFCRRTEKIIWTDRVQSEELFTGYQGRKEYSTYNTKKEG
jgi:hypothetical protein